MSSTNDDDSRARARACARSLLQICVSLYVLSLAPAAHAGDPAAAEALFREGRAQMDKGELAAACPKLEQSQKLDPSSGTMLNLALCHEKEGRIATAWAEYLVAARMARTQGRADRAQAAEGYASALEPKLSYLTVNVSQKVQGMVIRRGGTELDASALGSRLPIDPGEHVLTVSAPGKKTLELKLKIGAAGDAQTVVIPALENDTQAGAAPPGPAAAPVVATPTASPPSADAPRSPPPSATKVDAPVLPWVIGGVGVAALGVGGVFGVLALGSYADADAACPTHQGCSNQALDQRDRASLQANIANVGIGVGIVGIGVGAVLLITGSGKEAPQAGKVRVLPLAGPKTAGLVLDSRF
jgi:hypothetical protein